MATATTTPLAEAKISIAGLTIYVDRELATLAGWTLHSDGTATDENPNRLAERRLVRALAEVRAFIAELVARTRPVITEPSVSRDLLARCVELGEIESGDSRRAAARQRAADTEARAAADRLAAAKLELALADRNSATLDVIRAEITKVSGDDGGGLETASKTVLVETLVKVFNVMHGAPS